MINRYPPYLTQAGTPERRYDASDGYRSEQLNFEAMTVQFSGDIWFWKGPAPFYFVTIPEEGSRELKEIMMSVTYGWGMIPVQAQIGNTEWTTALWPKDGRYILPIKAAIRKAEKLDEGHLVSARLDVLADRWRQGL
jgi:hypothetical protein